VHDTLLAVTASDSYPRTVRLPQLCAVLAHALPGTTGAIKHARATNSAALRLHVSGRTSRTTKAVFQVAGLDASRSHGVAIVVGSLRRAKRVAVALIGRRGVRSGSHVRPDASARNVLLLARSALP
jgi:hypothetical protein